MMPANWRKPQTRPSGGQKLIKTLVTPLLVFCTMFVLIPGGVFAAYELGDTVEDFTLLDLDGNPVSLYDFQGDVILLNFFATWCPPCNDEALILEENFWQEYQDEGFTVLAVDLLEQAWVVEEWVEGLGLTYPTVLSPNWSIFTRFPDAGGIPYNALIDQNMVLRLSHYGFDEDEMREQVEELLEFSPVSLESGSLDAVKAVYR
jgi:peroxiredoxin